MLPFAVPAAPAELGLRGLALVSVTLESADGMNGECTNVLLAGGDGSTAMAAGPSAAASGVVGGAGSARLAPFVSMGIGGGCSWCCC